MRSFLFFLLLFTFCPCQSAEGHYYDIVSREMTNGSNQIYTVSCEMGIDALAKAIEEDRVLVFPKSFVYNVSTDSMIDISEWDKGLAGVLIIRGRDIVVVRVRKIDPTKLERIKQPPHGP